MTDRIAYPDSWPEEVFETARREGLWFFHGGLNGPLWFAPAELQAHHEKGEFLWGPSNWTLRDPYDRIAQLLEQKKAVDLEMHSVIERGIIYMTPFSTHSAASSSWAAK